MRLLVTVGWLLSCVLAMSACGEPEEAARADRGTTIGGSSDKTTAVSAGDLSPETTAPEASFPSSPTREGGIEGTADRITAVRFEDRGGYERAVIAFGGSRKGAARVPAWTLSRQAEGGYVRLTFPGVYSTATAGGDFVGLVMDEFYVVRDPDGGLFVDIFAIRPFRYRVLEFSDRGRLAVDYQPAPGGLRHPVVRGERTVILQPREAERVSSPLWVRGYTRHLQGSPSLALRGPDGEVLASKPLRTTGSAEAWGYFESKLDFTAKDGLATVLVGGRNSRVATFQGVEVPVFLEGG